ncbi:holo-ACP synthase [Dictyobacter arantiisoli]|uniref:Holo-[acyl-carrier-protein] synthase n=1 Tax=Dictyobacter arantiisoli TaxID=2014874 RepID=A0A5A5T9U2_9CHLR|nr:holo-ACP synthase [Dictyobacter arantiisoli]GCF08025.1 holo-[acyl-carrier-protein] synthase [Dictyobacter arantiisoli]
MRLSPYRVGIDIVEVGEIQASIDKFGSRYLEQVYTKEEQRYCQSLSNTSAKTQSFAVRFAAKEATIKVLRPHTEVIHWLNIEVHRYPAGWCDIELHAAAADLARQRGIAALSVSLSHEKNYATAVVIADFF